MSGDTGLQEIPSSELIARLRDFHLLTYAETGFAPLTIYGRRYGLDDEQLSSFAEAVNTSCCVMTLHPTAAISAMPRSYVRDVRPAAVHRAVGDFMAMNASSFKSRRIAFDFRTPNVAPALRVATEEALGAYAIPEAAIVVI